MRKIHITTITSHEQAHVARAWYPRIASWDNPTNSDSEDNENARSINRSA